MVIAHLTLTPSNPPDICMCPTRSLDECLCYSKTFSLLLYLYDKCVMHINNIEDIYEPTITVYTVIFNKKINIISL